MAFAVEVDLSKNLVHATADEATTIQELVESFVRLVENPRYQPGVRVFLDMGRYVHQATAADIRRIAEVIVERADQIPDTRLAAVVSRTVSYGMLRMLQALIDGRSFALHVTYEMADAEKFLGLA